MKIARTLWAGVAAGLALLAGAPSARAGAHTYTTRTETIRCGVLLANHEAWSSQYIPASGVNPHVFSYVFHALDSRPDIRPYGWEIVNPYASPFMDQSMANRYGLGTIPAGMAPRLNKNNGAYWEVFLHDVSADQLAQYDVLYMPMPVDQHGATDALSVDDREKLRRAVDGGAILWIDNPSGRTVSPANPAQMFVATAFQAGPTGARGRQVGDPLNALLNAPYALSTREVRGLGQSSNSSVILNIDVDGASRADAELGSLSWKTVMVNQQGKPTVCVASYGQGAIVVTSRGIGAELSQSFQAVAGVDTGFVAGNVGASSGSDARWIPSAELKFLVNLISYRFQCPQTGMGPRHASGSRQDLNTPLGSKWQFPPSFVKQPGGFKYSGTPFVSDPVVWSGVLYAATSDGYLRAYDMDPTRDLDGDGNPNDGLQTDAYPGSDILWSAKLPNPGVCSSLTIADVDGRPVVYGMLANGTIFMADALPRQNGRISGTPAIKAMPVKNFGDFPPLYKDRMTTTPAFAPGEEKVYRIPAPVFYNGRLFVAGRRRNPDSSKGIGALAEINPSNLNTIWQFPDGCLASGDTVEPQSRMGLPSATPTIAALQDTGYSGATDIMLVVSTLSIRSSDNVGTTQPSRIMAFPIAVRGERLQFNGETDSAKKGYNTRFAGSNAIQTTPPVCYDPDGNRYVGTMRVDTTSGFKRMYVDLTTANVPEDYDKNLRADYDFVPQMPENNFKGYNARWSFDAWSYILGTVNKFMEITTTPVVDQDGGIYFVACDVGDGGNQAPIVMGVKMRQQSQSTNVLDNPRYLPPLNTPQLTFIYSVGSSVAGGSATGASQNQPVVLGSTAIDRGILYAAWGKWDASDKTNSDGGVTGFLVRDAKFGLLLANPVDPAQKGNVQVAQRNRFTNDLQQVGYGLFDVDNISVGSQLRGLLTFRSLSTGAGAPSVDLSRVADMEVTYPALNVTTGQSAQVTGEIPTPYYKTFRGEGSSQDMLLAFDAKVPSNYMGTSKGRGIRTGVTVAGGAIYVGSDSGDVWTVPLPTDIDVMKKATAAMRPATFPNLTASAGFSAGQYPAVSGSTDPNMGSAMRCSPVVASGTLVMNSPVGVYNYYSPRTLITDGSRILEVASDYTPQQDATSRIFRSGSAAVWSLDSTTQLTDLGTPGIGPEHPPWGVGQLPTVLEKALSQPAMAIRVNNTNTLICDTGNNRVVEVDRSGRVVWQCTEFADPYGLLGANESRALSSPTSVQRWESVTYDENDRAVGREQHTLIADYGNNRILELVSRFVRDDNLQANNILVWVGKGPEGTPYKFYQAEREPLRKAGDENNGSLDYGRTIASVVNLQVNSADVQIDDSDFAGARTGRPATPGGSLVILSGQKDTVNGKTLPDDGRRGFVVWFLNRMRYGGDASKEFPLARPVFFSRTTTGAGAFQWRVTMTDGQNIFDLLPVAGKAGVANIPVSTDGPIVAYKPIGPVSGGGFGSAGLTVGTSMAKRLNNGDILIVNQKTGYVLEYSPSAVAAASNATEMLAAFRFTAPPISGTGALTRPTFADRIY